VSCLAALPLYCMLSCNASRHLSLRYIVSSFLILSRYRLLKLQIFYIHISGASQIILRLLDFAFVSPFTSSGPLISPNCQASRLAISPV